MLRALLLLTLVNCGNASNTLYGTVSEIYELQFDKVVVNRVEQYLVIEYQKQNGAKTIRLAVYVADLTIKPENAIDLADTVGARPRATIQRDVDSTVDLGVKEGTLTLSGPVEAGATLTGSFRAKTQAPAGRTLNGDFKGIVTQL